LFADPALLAAHRAMLPPMPERKPGDVDVARAVALAKLEDLTSLHEASVVLTPRETMALLSDTRGMSRLGALERGSPGLKNVK
jgi:membrane glycosyltransferase